MGEKMRLLNTAKLISKATFIIVWHLTQCKQKRKYVKRFDIFSRMLFQYSCSKILLFFSRSMLPGHLF